MNELRKAKDVIRKLLYILSKKQKRYAVLVLVMSLLAALLETLGVAVIMPVLDMMLDIQGVRGRWYMSPFVKILHLDTELKVIWFVCLGVIGIYLIKTLYFVLYSWVSAKYSYMVQRELSVRVLEAYMKQGYLFFVQNNTARLINGISADAASIYGILKTIFTCVMKLLTIVCIGVYIMVQSVQMAIVLMILAVLCLITIQMLYRKSMSRNGVERRNLMCDMNQVAMEAIQGHKEVLVMNKQEHFVKEYGDVKAKYSSVSVKVDMGTTVPAYLIEMICITGVMIAVAVQMGNTSNANELITQLSAIAAGAFRILPALGVITSGINTITMSTSQLNACYETIQQVKQLEEQEYRQAEGKNKYSDVQFHRSVELQQVSFKYPGIETNVIENVNLTIKKGESIAFIGSSGAGKTTIADIILALLKPTKGKILMDGIDVEDLGSQWNHIIGYVPQATYIIDGTIRSNIAFGENKEHIDDNKIWQALEISQLNDFVKNLPKGLDTMVGERGVRFSGGQRQRLAIARALYRDPDILVLDEATAALDNDTETEVMKAIEALQGYKTLIIVAHRLTTVKKCDIIYEIKNGTAVKKDKKDIFGEE
ncbi:MAG: ABC transporter ATP-binding protein [Lachnospiraceae bacterium]|jgi:ABC-type multidrug transport system fused ATPase/permease subunit|nr:ABC transporter ATP-binding protein [Lachnospiraceae bacterium]